MCTSGAHFTNMNELLIPTWISNSLRYTIWDEIIYKFERRSRWSLGRDKSFHTTLYWACDYLFMLELEWIHVNKKGIPDGNKTDVCEKENK